MLRSTEPLFLELEPNSREITFPEIKLDLDYLSRLPPEDLAAALVNRKSYEFVKSCAKFLDQQIDKPDAGKYKICYALLASKYLTAHGANREFLLAEKYAAISVSQGYQRANVVLGLIQLDKASSRADYERASSYFLNASKAGSVIALEQLGQLYFENKLSVLVDGEDSPTDTVLKSLQYLKQAEQMAQSYSYESHNAQFFLGCIYREGFVYQGEVLIERDLKLAFQYFKKSKAECLPAITAYGLALCMGEGTEVNIQKGVANLEFAKKQGCKEATMHLFRIFTTIRPYKLTLAMEYAADSYAEGNLLAAVACYRAYKMAKDTIPERYREQKERENLIRLKKIWVVDGVVDGLFEIADYYKQKSDTKNYLATISEISLYGVKEAQAELIQIAINKCNYAEAYKLLLVSICCGFEDIHDARSQLEQVLTPQLLIEKQGEASAIVRLIRHNLSKKRVFNFYHNESFELEFSAAFEE